MMKKLNLSKKTVVKLSEENLKNIQGGKKKYTNSGCCTNIEDGLNTGIPVEVDGKEIVIPSCRR